MTSQNKKNRLTHAFHRPGAIKIDVFDENTVPDNTVGCRQYWIAYVGNVVH